MWWLILTVLGFFLSLFLHRHDGERGFWIAFAGLLFAPFLFANLILKLLVMIWRS